MIGLFINSKVDGFNSSFMFNYHAILQYAVYLIVVNVKLTLYFSL